VDENCPHCGMEQVILLAKAGDRADYRCPSCGQFRVSGTDLRRMESGHFNTRRARLVDRAGRTFLTDA
jgi:uncharacterized Zn finger protein